MPDGSEKTAQEFCKENERAVSRIVRFLTNAKPIKPVYNKACTKVWFGLRYGKTVVRIMTSADDLFSFPIERDMTLALVDKFGLSPQMREWVRQSQFRPDGVPKAVQLARELGIRGCAAGFAMVTHQATSLRVSGEPQKLQAERKIKSDLNRALGSLRKAHESGATIRQLRKLVRTIAAEEAVTRIHES